jgi:hypothetical protein
MLDQAGFWDGILIGGNVTSNSKLDFVQIGHGGGGSTAGANLKLNAPIAVTNSKFYSSSTYGIVAPMTFMQDYEGLNTFDSNSMGTVQRD